MIADLTGRIVLGALGFVVVAYLVAVYILSS